MTKRLIVRISVTVLFVLLSAAALAHGHITNTEFQLARGVVYAFIALALMLVMTRSTR